MTLRIALALPDQAHLVHQTMREAYAEYDGVLIPPSGALRESVEEVRAAMSKGGAVLAWEGDTVVGSARFQWYPDYVYIGRVAVIPTQRGKGVGAALMQFIETVAREKGYYSIQLGVRMSLPGNLAFYQHIGYEILKTQPHDKGGDMVAWMGKQL